MNEIETSMQAVHRRTTPTCATSSLAARAAWARPSLAGATAIWLAKQGKRVMLASTNPVHSLSGLLGQNVFGKPTAGQRRAEPVGLRDRYQGHDRTLQAGDPREDPVVPEVRRYLHQGRGFRRIGHDEPGLRRIGHVREHGRSDARATSTMCTSSTPPRPPTPAACWACRRSIRCGSTRC